MSAELIAIIAAAIALGGVISGQIMGVRSGVARLDGRIRAVETELAYLRGLLQGGGLVLPVKPVPPANTDKGAA